MTDTLAPEFTSVLAEARQLYVGLESRKGPHVTPELYAWSDGRLWFAVATSTLKARVLGTGQRVAGVVSAGGRMPWSKASSKCSTRAGPRAAAADALYRAPPEHWRHSVCATAPTCWASRGDAVAGALPSRIPELRILIADRAGALRARPRTIGSRGSRVGRLRVRRLRPRSRRAGRPRSPRSPVRTHCRRVGTRTSGSCSWRPNCSHWRTSRPVQNSPW